MYPLTSLTPQTLISGFVDEGKPDPSLLPKLDGKILIVKDLTPLISGSADVRSAVLGQLRDAYDGSSAKAFGTGDVKRYESRFGMLFGVTPVIEANPCTSCKIHSTSAAQGPKPEVCRTSDQVQQASVRVGRHH